MTCCSQVVYALLDIWSSLPILYVQIVAFRSGLDMDISSYDVYYSLGILYMESYYVAVCKTSNIVNIW